MPSLTPHPPGHLLDPYQDLKGRSARREPYAWAICEGAFLVEAALSEARSGSLRIASVLASESRQGEWVGRVPADIPLLVLPDAELHALLGFPFHRGVLACVEPPAEPPLSGLVACRRLLVLPRVDQEENLGLLLRSAAALGMEGVLLGGGVSPWARRTVRTSMGAVFRIPIWRREDPTDPLRAWRSAGGETVAAALGPGSEDARRWRPDARTALILGPEDRGLDHSWLEQADRRLCLPMHRGMDSLNVAAAGAIFMARLCEGS